MKCVLMVAYHFPPLAGSSGIQRTLRFAQQLPEFGWQPLILSAHPRAYERTGDDLEREVPAGTVVRRAFALDSARHFALKGRHFGFLARPDRWTSWKYDGVRQGMQLIKAHQPAVIWSTFPIATAHLIGAELHRRTGLPWIADFRDPMAQTEYPTDPKIWKRFQIIERQTVNQARHSVFTTPGAVALYRERYPQVASRIELIENGYDEESFASAEAATNLSQPLNPGAITLLHSGIIYPVERDPTHLFQALGRLDRSGHIQAGRVKLRFRAAVHDDLINRLARENHIEPFIEVCPTLPYREALQEMLRAEALLVMQGRTCSDQIPAKVYEYIRAGRPTLCLCDPGGDTATVMRSAGLHAVARFDCVDDITARLLEFLSAVSRASADRPTQAYVEQASRRARSRVLAGLLNQTVS